MDKKMILIAGEQNFARSTLKGILSSRYFVVEVDTTKQAVNFMRNNSDVLELVIFTDSIDYRQLITEKATLKRDVALCLSVTNNNSDAINYAKIAGVDNFITYPYNENIVLGLVATILDSINRGRFLNSGFLNHYNQMIKENIKLEKNTIGSCRIDFDKQVVTNDSGIIHEFCQLDEVVSFTRIIECLSNLLLKDKKEDYQNTFSYVNISQNFENSDYSFDQVNLFLIDGKIMSVRSKIVNISSIENGPNTALFTLLDESDEYVRSKINAALFKTHYELVALVNTKEDSCSIMENNINFLGLESDQVSYGELISAVSENLMDSKDVEDFLNKVKLENIKEELSLSSTYHVATFVSKDKVKFYQISFKYLDEFEEKLIFIITNVTAQKEADAFTDALTYRGFLNQGTALVNESEEDYAVIYCECRNYKTVMDYINVDNVVLFLKTFYGAIKSSFLKPKIIGRSVNDSFWILAKTDQLDLEKLKSLSKIVIKDKDKNYYANLKYGVYRIPNDSYEITSTDFESFCERAKIACQAVNDWEEKNYSEFDSSFSEEFAIKTTIANEIKAETGENEIEVFLQPIYNIRTKKIAFAEALVRWNHPEYGYIKPDLFIPYLELNSGISEVDKAVIRKVDKFVDEMVSRKINIPVTVNLSRRDFFDKELTNLIVSISEKRAMEKTPLVAFEVTESFNVDITTNMSDVLKELKQNKAKILLDDFGDGVSSIKALQSSHFDVIKIYKGLVDQIATSKISRAAIISTVSMCHAVGIEVIAEGVEDKNQLDFLKKAKVDYVQGYIFSKPIQKEEFLAKFKK